jgi:hypothetical protein
VSTARLTSVMARAILQGLAVVALLTVLGGVAAAATAGAASEPIAERLTDMGAAISLGFGVSPLRWEVVPPPLGARTDVDTRSTAMSFDIKLRWPGTETSVVEPYVAFGPALFVVEPDDLSRLLGTRVDPALRMGAKAGVGLNWKLGKDTTFFSAYELSTAGHGGLGSPGARSSADSPLNGYDFTYGIRLRY